MKEHGACVRANFGASPFLFDHNAIEAVFDDRGQQKYEKNARRQYHMWKQMGDFFQNP